MSWEGVLVREPHWGGCCGGQRVSLVSGELSELELRRAVFLALLFVLVESGVRTRLKALGWNLPVLSTSPGMTWGPSLVTVALVTRVRAR